MYFAVCFFLSSLRYFFGLLWNWLSYTVLITKTELKTFVLSWANNYISITFQDCVSHFYSFVLQHMFEDNAVKIQETVFGSLIKMGSTREKLYSYPFGFLPSRSMKDQSIGLNVSHSGFIIVLCLSIIEKQVLLFINSVETAEVLFEINGDGIARKNFCGKVNFDSFVRIYQMKEKHRCRNQYHKSIKRKQRWTVL